MKLNLQIRSALVKSILRIAHIVFNRKGTQFLSNFFYPDYCSNSQSSQSLKKNVTNCYKIMNKWYYIIFLHVRTKEVRFAQCRYLPNAYWTFHRENQLAQQLALSSYTPFSQRKRYENEARIHDKMRGLHYQTPFLILFLLYCVLSCTSFFAWNILAHTPDSIIQVLVCASTVDISCIHQFWFS